MIHAQMTKEAVLIIPQQVATNATVTGQVDTLGYDYLTILGTLDTASVNPTVFKLSEGDTSTAHTDIAAFTGDDTTNGFTIPAADTSNASIYKLGVTLPGVRKRWIKASVTSGVAQIIGVNATLSRADDMPDSDTERGVNVSKFA